MDFVVPKSWEVEDIAWMQNNSQRSGAREKWMLDKVRLVHIDASKKVE